MRIDPAWFRPEAVAPETARFNAELEAQLADAPTLMDIGVPRMRALRRAGKGPFGPIQTSARAENRTVGAGRGVDVRVFRPLEEPVSGAYLHIHGGGWCLGGADMQDPRLQSLADALGIAVVSVEYRLAPEHPFPAAPDDCERAARWLLTEGSETLQTDRFVIGGESAGAHLAALTLLRLRDRPAAPRRGAPTGFVGASLVYGSYDLTLTPSARRWGERNLILSTPFIEWVVDRFVPFETFPRSRRRAPDISPLYARLDGLPPALFTVGTMDPLVDDSLMMAARWIAAGNDAQLAVFAGGVHGFDAFELPLAEEATRRQADFLRGALAAD